MNALDQTATRPRPVVPVALRARDVADLTVTSGYPCISVLLPTRPASRMTPEDLDQLHRLVGEVESQLDEHGVTGRDRLMAKLSEEGRRMAGQPTDRALAIYVSLAVTRSFRLPQPVEARAVVEGTFATRPLVSALHRLPPHVVLVLHATCAHLHAAADGGLHPVDQLDPFHGSGSIRLPGPADPGAEAIRSELDEDYLRAVDRMLGDYRVEHPSPLVLAGTPRLLDRFCAVSRNLERLAGRVHSGGEDTALDLARACTEAIEDYLRNRREEAMEQLAHALRVRPDDVTVGIEDCWRTLQTRAPGMLLVEDGFVAPGVGTDDPARPSALSDAGEVHDLVDDLIERVILDGGELALVRDGDLEPQARIALISRRPGHRRPAHPTRWLT